MQPLLDGTLTFNPIATTAVFYLHSLRRVGLMFPIPTLWVPALRATHRVTLIVPRKPWADEP